MKETTRGQALEVSARVATQVDWDAIDGDRLQRGVIDLTPEEFGRRLTAVFRNDCQLIVGEPKIIPIDRSKPFNPAEFVGAGWTIWRGPANGNGLSGDEEQDARSLALTEIDLSAIVFKSTLKPGESVVNGEEKLKRLKASGDIRLDAGAFKVLWDNRELLPARFKEKTNDNTTFVYCDGTVLRSPNGNRYVLCFYFSDGAWHWGCDWLGRDWDVNGPSAVLASQN